MASWDHLFWQETLSKETRVRRLAGLGGLAVVPWNARTLHGPSSVLAFYGLGWCEVNLSKTAPRGVPVTRHGIGSRSEQQGAHLPTTGPRCHVDAPTPGLFRRQDVGSADGRL